MEQNLGRRSTRDRRGRGMRGPGVMPTDPRTPVRPGRRQRFDELVLGIVSELEDRWHAHLGLVEYAVEDAPILPADWGEAVPLASLVRGRAEEPSRLVVFRRPLEHRAGSRSELEALVLTVVVEQMADLLGISPAEVDPRYRDD